MKCRIFLKAAMAASIATGAMGAGYQTETLAVDHRDADLPLFIWYPSDEPAELQLGKNAVFPGVAVAEDAPQSAGQYPLVLLSHGSGGNAVNIAWFANHLANQGYIVASTNHPNTTSRNSIPAETVKVWERTADMSAILDFIADNGFEGLTPDLSLTAAVGFSLGGHTALGLGGARVVRDDYAKHCVAEPDLHDCAWFAKAGVDLNATDKQRFEQSNRDPRIKAVLAIDPALSQAYSADSLAAMNLPVQIMNLGDPAEIPSTINGRKIMESLPNAEYAPVSQAWHFSFLGECSFIGKAIIAVAGDDPICTEHGNRPRSELHAEIAQKATVFLNSALPKPTH